MLPRQTDFISQSPLVAKWTTKTACLKPATEYVGMKSAKETWQETEDKIVGIRQNRTVDLLYFWAATDQTSEIQEDNPTNEATHEARSLVTQWRDKYRATVEYMVGKKVMSFFHNTFILFQKLT